MDLFARLSGSLPLALAVIGLLVLAIVLLLVLLVVRSRRRRYEVPGVPPLSEEGANLSWLLARAGLDLAAGPPEDATRHGCAWWLCERGALIEASGRYLLAAGGGRDQGA